MLSQLLVIVSDRSYGRQKLNGPRPNLPYPQRTTIFKHCRPWSVNRKNSQNVNELFNPVTLVYPLGHVLSYFSQNCDGIVGYDIKSVNWCSVLHRYVGIPSNLPSYFSKNCDGNRQLIQCFALFICSIFVLAQVQNSVKWTYCLAAKPLNRISCYSVPVKWQHDLTHKNL